MFRNFTLPPNYCRLRISPDITIAIGANTMVVGSDNECETVEMVAARQPKAHEMDAYERLLGDAMAGDQTLFAREDYVEEAWRIVDPVLKLDLPVHTLRAGYVGTAGSGETGATRRLERPVVTKPAEAA